MKCAGERALEKHVITFKMRIRAVYEDAGLPTGAKARVVGLLDKLGRSAPECLVEETLAEERVDSGSSAAMFGKEQIINLAWKVEQARTHAILAACRTQAADLLSVGDTEEYLRIEGDPFHGWCGMRLLSPTEEAVQYFDLMITAALIYVFASLPLCLAFDGAGQESEIPNFKGSYLGRFPLVLANSWTSDHLSERSRSVDVFFSERARAEHSR